MKNNESINFRFFPLPKMNEDTQSAMYMKINATHMMQTGQPDEINRKQTKPDETMRDSTAEGRYRAKNGCDR